MRRPLFPLMLVLGALLCGCTESPIDLEFSDVSGVYRLQVEPGGSITVQPDPAVARTMAATSGVLELQPTWTFDVEYDNEAETRTAAGNYTRTGSGVILRFYSGPTVPALISDGVVTVASEQGPPLVFEVVE